MNLKLKFLSSIVQPWETLNERLTEKLTVDSNISDLINIAEGLAIRLNHFPEIAKKSNLRGEKGFTAYQIIIDLANSTKHENLKGDKAVTMEVSSQFEFLEGHFRFIRNCINVHHPEHGRFDFLQIAWETADFLSKRLELNIFWKPKILEAPRVIEEFVYIGLDLANQISFESIRYEVLIKEPSGELVPFDPPEHTVITEDLNVIAAGNYFEYLENLIRNSIASNETLQMRTEVPYRSKKAGSQIAYLIQGVHRCGIEIFDSEEDIMIEDVDEWIEYLLELELDKLILIVKGTLTPKVVNHLSVLQSELYILNINSERARSIPLHFFNITLKQNTIGLVKVDSIVLNISSSVEKEVKQFLDPSVLEHRFSLDGENMIGLKSLLLSFVKPRPDQTNGTRDIKLDPEKGRAVYIKGLEEFYRVGLTAKFEWAMTIEDMKAPVMIFDQYLFGVSKWTLKVFSPSLGTELGMNVTKFGRTEAAGII
ncbi:MAG: hypothetical protein V4604_11910 [Bacteroidota bacterium]